MDILQTAEKIMKGSQMLQSGPGSHYLMPGTYCTADIPGSNRRVYKILSFENEGITRVKNVSTEKEYLIPREFLSAIMTDDAYNQDHIQNFLAAKEDEDSPELEKLRVDRIGIKKPGELSGKEKTSGIDIIGNSGGSYNRSRYDKSNQVNPIVPIRNLNSKR